MQKMRNKTREPYFDNRNKRRLDIDDPKGTIYADEYDNIVSLRNEVINRRWIVFKTLIIFREKNERKYFWTISYPGHYATVMAFASFFLVLAGLYFVIYENSFELILMSIVLYALIVFLSKDDYQSHYNLIKDCNKKKN